MLLEEQSEWSFRAACDKEAEARMLWYGVQEDGEKFEDFSKVALVHGVNQNGVHLLLVLKHAPQRLVDESFKLHPDGLLQNIGLGFQYLQDTIAKDGVVDRELISKGSNKPTGGVPVLLVAREEPAGSKALLGTCFRAEAFDDCRLANARDAIQYIDRHHTRGSPCTEIVEELLSGPPEALTDFAVDDLAVMRCRQRIEQLKELASSEV
jgi:hypothetical protein